MVSCVQKREWESDIKRTTIFYDQIRIQITKTFSYLNRYYYPPPFYAVLMSYLLYSEACTNPSSL